MHFKASMLAAAATILLAGAAQAHTFQISYGNPGEQTANSVVVSNADTLGVENFDGLPTGNSAFNTDYGTGNVIVGHYTGTPSITGADQYGGADGTGHQIKSYNADTYTITFTNDGSIPGVNYFGFWLSALDHGNQLVFKNGGVTVGVYTPDDLLNALGNCPNAYCGNPTAPFLGQDSGEPFAFVNFVDLDGFFDEIDIYEDPHVGDYESDNHTVAYCRDPKACVTGNLIGAPEPISLSLFGAGLAAAGFMRRRKSKA